MRQGNPEWGAGGGRRKGGPHCLTSSPTSLLPPPPPSSRSPAPGALSPPAPSRGCLPEFPWGFGSQAEVPHVLSHSPAGQRSRDLRGALRRQPPSPTPSSRFPCSAGRPPVYWAFVSPTNSSELLFADMSVGFEGRMSRCELWFGF